MAADAAARPSKGPSRFSTASSRPDDPELTPALRAAPFSVAAAILLPGVCARRPRAALAASAAWSASRSAGACARNRRDDTCSVSLSLSSSSPSRLFLAQCASSARSMRDSAAASAAARVAGDANGAPNARHSCVKRDSAPGPSRSGASASSSANAATMASAGGGVGAADSAGMRSAIGRTASSIAVQYGE